MSGLLGLVILFWGEVASVAEVCDVGDAQSAHEAGQPARRSGVNFFRQFIGDGRHETGHAGATDSSHHENVRKGIFKQQLRL